MDQSYIQKTNTFYMALAHIFYAVAAADKKVNVKEKKALSEKIKLKWGQLNCVSLSADDLQQVLQIFEQLVQKHASASESLRFFKKYRSQHPEKFSIIASALIWSTALSVASAYSQKNKSELIMLNDLRLILLGQDNNKNRSEAVFIR